MLLWLTIHDSGIGIAADTLPAIFQPFQQADNSTTRRFGGSGLGLSICAELTDLMDGALVVGSQPQRGSTFVCGVPCAIATQPLPAAADDADAAALGGSGGKLARRGTGGRPRANTVGQRPWRPLILVAEDNAVNARVLSRQLAQLGCDCIVVTNGVDAVAQVRRFMARHAIAAVAGPSGADSGGSGGAGSPAAVPPPLPAAAAGYTTDVLEGRPAAGAPADAAPLHGPRGAPPMPRRVTEPPAGGSGDSTGAGGAPADGSAPGTTADRLSLVLMDLDMPLMDGITAAQTIRKLEEDATMWLPAPAGAAAGGRRSGQLRRTDSSGTARPHLPIVALTAADRSIQADACRVAGMDHYLAKPTTVATLRVVLEQCIGKWTPA